MESNDLIKVQQFCTLYDIPVSFINSLNEFELIEIVTIRETQCINQNHIKEVEKMIRLHYDLDINMEGIDVISKLLKQIESLQEKIIDLNNSLIFYEDK
jgi:chaperone modulatory protein CbpM